MNKSNFENTKFEILYSTNQELTFKESTKFFEQKGIDLSSRLREFGFIRDNLYINLALLFSDQNPFSIKVGVFNDDENTSFIKRKEFFGSVLKQLEDIIEFILIMVDFAFGPSERKIKRSKYQKWVLKEALVNSIVHRDYNLGSSTIININPKRIEFISLGGLYRGNKRR